jgi:hypothetical protein
VGREMKLRSIFLFLPICLMSCATPPKQAIFDKTKTFDMSKDAVWEDLLSFFTSNNIQIKTIEKDSGVIYAERSGVDATMADCGDVPLAVEVLRSGTLNVFVRSVGSKTQVTVNSDFKVTRMFDNQTYVQPCNSTGLLEKSILESIN